MYSRSYDMIEYVTTYIAGIPGDFKNFGIHVHVDQDPWGSLQPLDA